MSNIQSIYENEDNLNFTKIQIRDQIHEIYLMTLTVIGDNLEKEEEERKIEKENEGEKIISGACWKNLVYHH